VIFTAQSTLADIEKFRKKEGDLVIQIRKYRGCPTWNVRFFQPSPLGSPAPMRHVASGESKRSVGQALNNAAEDYERFKQGLHNG